VRDDLALLSRVKPDLVVGDFRVSLTVSARVAGVKYVSLTNAYWSPLARIRHLVPEFDWVRWPGPAAAQVLFNLFERLGYAQHAVPINRLRRSHGMTPLGSDFRNALVDADLTCFADLPEVVPTAPLPANQCFIGPVPWSPDVARPAWWDDVCERPRTRPLVYVSLGSSGAPGGLQHVLDGLAQLPVDAIVSTAGRSDAPRVPANAHLAELLPGDDACAAADLVLCNGGSPGTYQALTHGKPVIGLPTNMDQFLNMAAVEDAGCGRLLRGRAANAAAIARAVTQVLNAPAMTQRTQAIARAIAQAPAPERFVSLVRTALQR